ncbi:HNH endonuclease [Maridesulfovibrio ferrireducens]|uniref:HNH endonuclease n=1 Tax=Maridesulfovibrio ferrireducens TaxID=246191 RepID=UPI001A265F78|nr:HNH endonuclease [Maridesulfovibrio ferrireducens]MBI9112746.1 HNH endonuclease [Maridesulfovibrio ferrireducens]
MRPVVRGSIPTEGEGEDITFTKYSQARGPLIERLGPYCSYCEIRLDSALAVEHIQPKKREYHPELELVWDNFLLACSNCNSTKGDTNVVLEDYHWPDQDNTYRLLQYSEGGLVHPADDLTPEETQKAWNIIKLTGLDKRPTDIREVKDRRRDARREAWDTAQDSKADLEECDCEQMRRQVVRSMNSFWSVWMTVFKDDPDMCRRFIEALPGTCKECFDGQDSYKPIPR